MPRARQSLAVVITGGVAAGETPGRDSIMIRVDDACAHCERARRERRDDRNGAVRFPLR